MEKSMKKYFFIATYIVVLYWALTNLELVANGFSFVIGILSPILIGIFIAFVFNIPLTFIEKCLIKKVDVAWINKKKRMLSIVLTYLFAIVIISTIIFFLVPQVIESSKTLVNKFPQYGESLQEYGEEIYTTLGISDEIWNEIFGSWQEIAGSIGRFTANTVDRIYDFTIGIASGVIKLFIGLVFSIYILLYKEKLLRIMRKLNITYMSEKVSLTLFHIGDEVNQTFAKFVGGQLTEAMILGSLCFLGMVTLQLPYAPLVSVLIAITSLIPILGAYIGTVPAVFIIFMENPMQALVFIIFILIIQQIEGNFIYPKVVGNAIGLDGFWVFLAIIIGGNLFGVLGMLLGVPSMAVIYTLVKEVTNNRYKKIDKYDKLY